jgi:glycosyltransferase involved in cell wall biosynthesis
MQLANGFQRRGIHVEVLTPRYASSWTKEFVYRNIKVHRVAGAPRGDWSMGRYVRHLTTWLREHAQSFDVLFSDSAREECIAAVEAARTIGCRSAVRVRGWGSHSDLNWWNTSRSARRCAGFAKTADRVFVPSAASHRGLIQAGFAANRISRIDTGFAGGIARSESSRRASRRSLAAINGDLHVQDDQLVLVCVDQMTRHSGMQLLTQSARDLVARYHELQLWFIGDGPHRESMFDYLRGEGVRRSIAMPGSFADIGGVLAAADLFVQSDESGLDFLLPAAISAELPIVALDSDSTRELLSASHRAGDRSATNAQPQATESDTEHLLQWFQGSAAGSLRAAIRNTIDDLPGSRQRAASLRRLMLRTRPLDQTIDEYARLMEQTVLRTAAQQTDRSIGAVS